MYLVIDLNNKYGNYWQYFCVVAQGKVAKMQIRYSIWQLQGISHKLMEKQKFYNDRGHRPKQLLS